MITFYKTIFRIFNITLFFLIIFSESIFSQETEKKYYDNSYWTLWNVDYELNNSDSLFFEVNTRSSAFDSYIIDGLNINRAHIMLGYAHKFKNKKLMVGGSIRDVFEPNWNVLFLRAFFQHNGQIGGGLLDFQKRLQYEQILHNKTGDTSGNRDDYGRIGFWIMLGRNFTIAQAKLRAEFSYELFVNTNNSSSDDRSVDLTRLRFDVYYRFAEDKFRVGLFAMRDTQYYFAPASGPSYDANGNLISEGKPERNLNLITPTYGITFKYSIRQKEECNCPGEKKRR
ncbi:hypothetical protein EI427_08440 [Flammeovirga pectinis]|uniref:DUF2490 domain-containing protein n=1 Tax=Flammeovirga pectinis TaxID=2494373 RepID=A0A3S9P257_9BACT|nr:DUF2490 domain-containing protein [Flammeovirga pectinis]AZQ62263.1 hypothetical protein EI427_08440 [Flammeovirga pectinis]